MNKRQAPCKKCQVALLNFVVIRVSKSKGIDYLQEAIIKRCPAGCLRYYFSQHMIHMDKFDVVHCMLKQ